jgi:23S rRNA pseudouridine2457 synthase
MAILAFHKPFRVLSQFTTDGSTNRPLAEFGFPKHFYPLGRLDADSEGLLLLSDEPGLNHRLMHPTRRHRRVYWVQVERIPSPPALMELERGVMIQGKRTLPCKVTLLEPAPEVEPRNPPIRYRKSVPESWLEMELVEGRNRQIRHMTATVGHPTLRLMRVRIGSFQLGTLAPGTWRELSESDRPLLFE